MKKLILSLVFVTSLFLMSSTSTVSIGNENIIENEMVRPPCVGYAVDQVTEIANALNQDIRGANERAYIKIFQHIYEECMEGNEGP
jgi:hypothetical protein